MLPNCVINELFNVKHRTYDMSITYIVDELQKLIQVERIADHDLFIYIHFSSGLLKIDRLKKQFILNQHSSIPIIGNFEIVFDHLYEIQKLEASLICSYSI